MAEVIAWSKLTPDQKNSFIQGKEFADNIITEEQIEALLKIYAVKKFDFPTPAELRKMSIGMASALIKTQLKSKNFRDKKYSFVALKERFWKNEECRELMYYISEQHSYYGR
jgi:hypothetical protein